MYRISNNKRKYSPTPIVRVEKDENGKEKEIYVGCLASPKEEGDKLSENFVGFLNKKEMDETEAYDFALKIFEEEEGRKPVFTGGGFSADEIAVSCIHTGILHTLKYL